MLIRNKFNKVRSLNEEFHEIDNIYMPYIQKAYEKTWYILDYLIKNPDDHFSSFKALEPSDIKKCQNNLFIGKKDTLFFSFDFIQGIPNENYLSFAKDKIIRITKKDQQGNVEAAQYISSKDGKTITLNVKNNKEDNIKFKEYCSHSKKLVFIVNANPNFNFRPFIKLLNAINKGYKNILSRNDQDEIWNFKQQINSDLHNETGYYDIILKNFGKVMPINVMTDFWELMRIINSDRNTMAMYHNGELPMLFINLHAVAYDFICLSLKYTFANIAKYGNQIDLYKKIKPELKNTIISSLKHEFTHFIQFLNSYQVNFEKIPIKKNTLQNLREIRLKARRERDISKKNCLEAFYLLFYYKEKKEISAHISDDIEIFRDSFKYFSSYIASYINDGLPINEIIKRLYNNDRFKKFLYIKRISFLQYENIYNILVKYKDSKMLEDLYKDLREVNSDFADTIMQQTGKNINGKVFKKNGYFSAKTFKGALAEFAEMIKKVKELDYKIFYNIASKSLKNKIKNKVKK